MIYFLAKHHGVLGLNGEVLQFLYTTFFSVTIEDHSLIAFALGKNL